MTDVLRGRQPIFFWKAEQQKAFETIKDLLLGGNGFKRVEMLVREGSALIADSEAEKIRLAVAKFRLAAIEGDVVLDAHLEECFELLVQFL